MTGLSGRAALKAAAAELGEAGVEDPAGDARRLLAAALRLQPDQLTFRLDEPLGEDAELSFRAYVAQRNQRQPVSQILGGRWFYRHWFEVTCDTLDPRPETELLVDLALAEPFAEVLDLGTGTGCILLSLLAARPEATGIGTDISDAALAVAARNARDLGVEGRCRLIRSDWYSGTDGAFDLIVSNPPYIALDEMAGLAPEVRLWEPRGALTDEGDGLSAYRAIAAGAPDHLAPRGRLIVEIGAAQGPAVAGIFRTAGLDDIAVHPDLAGRDRAVSARKA